MKKKYEKPELKKHGDLKKITKGFGVGGADMQGGPES
ncbi:MULTISPECIES: lasso RiPP family leader peptide-containing protein [Methanobacterium]|uniref:Lasso RiPP family leader peptide-containing protein n=1 Tax=Methanobacterium veterum TaxID=408577 RepID=A0A9E5A057_9EURY|nr:MULTISPECIES: lasso RiPP family leader peptide-containing protein [Methanobacterium]MCZ3364272.1 lasso RiPP family leader peptide-containing protein [Methanobacterium veterum]MCZ3372019.1 lasso RiPP family leader peptide-containing protein [Methanobacterium veterum]